MYFKALESHSAKQGCGCQHKLDLGQIGRLSEDIDIALHKLAETAFLRTVCAPYIAHLQCLKGFRQCCRIIGIETAERHGKIITETSVHQIVFRFGIGKI